MKYLALLAIFAAFFCCSAFADCSVNIKQTLGSAWQQEGKNLSQWNVAITAGSEAVKSLELTITGATINQLWELTNKSNNVFALPDWRLQNGGIPAGQTHQFGYIWQSPSQATITVSSIDCGAVASPSPSASPAAPSPSPSASPAAPSASPSAAPSTIVSTPQPSPAGSCSVNIKQTLGSAWQQDGKNLSQWNAVITAGSQAVKSLELTITGARLIQVWELNNKSNGVFALPDYRLQNGGLAAGQTHQFGYIWESASQATITVSSINCGAAAPSPSASPAAPSASASPAAPSASPSTIVSTPQPSSAPAGCSLKVDQAARSTQDGSWTTGDFKFQIYDLTFTNNGNQAVNGAQINVALNANQEIYQFWNIERQSANSNGFNVPMSWGPLQVGATLGAGYIVRSPVSAGNIAAPAVTITSTTCSGSTTAAPSPSASPAAPSASPSANPTIVATPQPSSANGCSATVSVVARSAASGGVWQNGGATFQIFDISLQNNGQRAVNGGVFTFGFAESGASIFQFWELNRQGSSNAFNVAFNYGPLQAGASQGSGIVVRLAGSTPAAVPTVTLSSLACQ